MNKNIKYFSSKAKETDDDRTLEFIGSTENIDRDHEVIKLSGWRLTNFKKNPVVLVNHNPRELPVAKATKVWVDKADKALKFRVKFPEADVSPQGDTLFKLYKNGFMNATSVGFVPNRDKMVFGDPQAGEPRITFKEQELLELSLVSIPANIDAIVTARKGFKDAVEAGIVDELEITDLELWMKELGFDLDSIETKIETEKGSIKEEIVVPVEKETKDINIHECKSCGVELDCLCPECKDEKDTNDYFEKLYTDIIFQRQEEDTATA